MRAIRQSKKINIDTVFKKAVKAHRDGDSVLAIKLYKQINDIDKSHDVVWTNLGSLLLADCDYEGAMKCFMQALSCGKLSADKYFNLANAERALKRLSDAVVLYKKAIEVNPLLTDAYYNLALTLAELGDINEAVVYYEKLLEVDSSYYAAYINLGAIYNSLGMLTKSISRYETAIELNCEFMPAYNNLGTALQDAGRYIESIETQKIALQKDPSSHRTASNILMTMQYMDELSDEELFLAAKSYADRFPPARVLKKKEIQNGKLKIGYVSADMFQHVVGLFFQPILQKHDTSKFEVYVYNNSPKNDNITKSIASLCSMRNIRDVPDDVVMRQIENDGIDILIDLSGHTAGNRLPIFAKRAAPVQISWLGYYATTGLGEMDFIILDSYHAPAGADKYFTECIIRLPHNRFCFTPVVMAPDVSPSPFEKNGFVTFGSFNNTAKLTDRVLHTWAKILKLVPESRLILKYRTFADADYCNRLYLFFEAEGIERKRLEFRCSSPHKKLLEEYGDIDIALDPFPFSGGQTSCESLWMGVPVVTLPQNRIVSRQTFSFLSNIGLQGLAVGNVDSYISLAVSLAKSENILLELRRTLRQKMANSVLCDTDRFVRILENAYIMAYNAKQ